MAWKWREGGTDKISVRRSVENQKWDEAVEVHAVVKANFVPGIEGVLTSGRVIRCKHTKIVSTWKQKRKICMMLRRIRHNSLMTASIIALTGATALMIPISASASDQAIKTVTCSTNPEGQPLCTKSKRDIINPEKRIIQFEYQIASRDKELARGTISTFPGEAGVVALTRQTPYKSSISTMDDGRKDEQVSTLSTGLFVTLHAPSIHQDNTVRTVVDATVSELVSLEVDARTGLEKPTVSTSHVRGERILPIGKKVAVQMASPCVANTDCKATDTVTLTLEAKIADF